MQTLFALAARQFLPGADIDPATKLARQGQEPRRGDFGSGRPMGCAVHAFMPFGAADAEAACRKQGEETQSCAR